MSLPANGIRMKTWGCSFNGFPEVNGFKAKEVLFLNGSPKVNGGAFLESRGASIIQSQIHGWVRTSRRGFSIMDRYKQLRPTSEYPSVLDREAQQARNNEEQDLVEVFPRTRATFARTPVPESARFMTWMPPQSPPNSKFLRVGLLGPPNSGKSSLLNALLAQPISAVSPKVNTTFSEVRGVKTEDNTQVCFVDVPGIIPINEKKVAQDLVAKAWNGYKDADVCLLVIDAVKRPTQALFNLVRKIAPFPEVQDMGDKPAEPLVPIILVLNKIDLASDKKWIIARSEEFFSHGRFSKLFFISAKKERGVTTLWEHLKTSAMPGEWVFPKDVITSLSHTEQVEQLIRTYLFSWFNKDLPYRVEQQTVGWTERPDGKLIIEQELIVKDSVAARIILGVRNSLVYRMSSHVSRRLEALWQRPVKVLIWVKPLKNRESFFDKQKKIKIDPFTKI